MVSPSLAVRRICCCCAFLPMRHLRSLYSTRFHGKAQSLRYALRFSTGDEGDPHARLDQKLVAAPALLQQGD
jgi:hypothetical protein